MNTNKYINYLLLVTFLTGLGLILYVTVVTYSDYLELAKKVMNQYWLPMSCGYVLMFGSYIIYSYRN